MSTDEHTRPAAARPANPDTANPDTVKPGKAKKAKPFRPKARRPRGFEDKAADVLRAERDLVARASAVYEAHGFAPLETSAFEYADALGKFLPDDDRPNEGVFALQDDDEQWLSLRYDLTAPLARFAAENFDALAKPFRRYQAGPVWRNEKPGPGRFREFIQCDADCVGAAGPAADAEMIALAVKVMGAAGLEPGEFVVRFNDRRILDALLADIGVPEGPAGAVQRGRVMRSIDKLDRFGADGVRALLGAGREDDSGDFTPGAELTAAQIEKVDLFFTATDRLQNRMAASNDGGAANSAVVGGLQGEFDELPRVVEAVGAVGELIAMLEAMGLPERSFAFDTAIVRGLGYYTGPVFEAELLLTVADAKGRPVRVGSIGGGGRYDDLVSRFKGQAIPATGFSFGVSRFAAALKLAGRLGGEGRSNLAVVLALEPDQMADYFALAEQLRVKAKIPAEVFLGGGNMGKQLKYADKRGARFALIIGEDERKARQVTIKDLALGAALSKEIQSNAEWRASRPAQETLARGKVVGWIKAALKAGAPALT